MKRDEQEALQGLTGIELIRRKPEMFAGEKPWGSSLSVDLIKDIVCLGAMPATVEQVKSWWVVSSEKDWLSSGGGVDLNPFKGVVRIPELGAFAIRTEVVIAALSVAVVTSGSDGTTWIAGDEDKISLPAEIDRKIKNIKKGRLVAFMME